MNYVISFVLIIFIYAVLFLATHLITRRIPFADSSTEAIKTPHLWREVLLVAILNVLLTFGYIQMISHFFFHAPQLLVSVLQILFELLTIALVIAIVLHKRESLRTIGFCRKYNLRAIGLGCLLGILYNLLMKIIFYGLDWKQIFSISSLLSFIGFLFVGFSEEIIMRGYLQTRFIELLGTKKGILITALYFSLFHLPQRILFQGMDPFFALLSCLELLPIALLLAFIMYRSKNIVVGAIFHAFIDWV